MRTAYRVLALLVVAGVFVQAGSIAFGWFDVIHDLEDGGSFDKDSEFNFGHVVHGMNGMMVIPVLALVLVIISFFAKVPGGVKWALYVFAAVVVQVALGIFGRGLPLVVLLHGANALILFSVAFMAAHRVRRLSPQASLRADESVPAAR